MTAPESAMCTLMDVFGQYAKEEGKKDTLSKAEAKKLLTEQFPGLLKKAKKPEVVDKLISSLDINGDAEIDFAEFLVIVGSITCACHGRCTKK
ncbi:protein S100-P-like [Gouania willdenowi]|uniref:Protein S100-P-like n=1 Tax=Gouania willdenowi TaxID=441366 RepID=A0A8C5ED67_GOUWI|nr:protein S100-P-like [Gouania willdenowi]